MMNTNFNELPEEVQERAKNVLKCFPRVYISFGNGEYTVSSGVGIYAVYPEDFKSIGCYTDTEIFTEEERIENYMNEFHEYAPNYKGKRDYRAKNAYEENHKGTWNLKLVNGNFEF